jgi:hypothetical protein
LRAQSLPREEWELILVDNVSHAPLAEAWDLSWHPNARHLAEQVLGLAAARMCGMKASTADLLVFVDDDNVLDKTYLANALEIKALWPSLGAWGSGIISPEYELEPAIDVKDFLFLLAIRETEKPRWSNVYPCEEAIPWGAGLCVRAAVADAYCRANNESSILLTGRRGNSLLAGDDHEIAYLACELGLGMGVFPQLRLTHLISKNRVSRKHLLKLALGAEASDGLLKYKWNGAYPRLPCHPRDALAILKNLVMRRGLHRNMYLAQVRGSILARKIIADANAKRK